MRHDPFWATDQMLPPELAAALKAARKRTGFADLSARIGDDDRPGLVTVHRGAVILLQRAALDAAVEHVTGLPAKPVAEKKAKTPG